MSELVESSAAASEYLSPEAIINKYKTYMAECQQYASKMNEFNFEKDEHRLVLEKLAGLEPERKAFRLVGGVLVERTVGEVLPFVEENYQKVYICMYMYLFFY